MKIGVDARKILRNATGLGNYGRTLVCNMSELIADNDRLLLFSPDEGKPALKAISIPQKGELVVPTNLSIPLYKRWWQLKGMVKDIRKHKVNVFHGLNAELPKGISKVVPAILTVHDLIFLRHPEWYKPIDRWLYTRRFYNAINEATHIIAISECTKRDIIEYGKVPEEKISVIYQSCSTRFAAPVDVSLKHKVREKYHLTNDFILFVGTIEERKNALEIVEALPYLEGVDAVIVGRRTPYADRIEAKARELGVAGRVHLLSGIDDETLHALYHSAAVFGYPSRYEGFGIPIIEAMEAGLPVVAATGSCLEEAGGKGSLYVSPDDPKAFAEAIKRMLTGGDWREQAICEGLEYVKKFDGKKVAQQVIDIYNRYGK